MREGHQVGSSLFLWNSLHEWLTDKFVRLISEARTLKAPAATRLLGDDAERAVGRSGFRSVETVTSRSRPTGTPPQSTNHFLSALSSLIGGPCPSAESGGKDRFQARIREFYRTIDSPPKSERLCDDTEKTKSHANPAGLHQLDNGWR